MANAPSPPWRLTCPWCTWRLTVSARGMRGNDPGAGVEAALLGQRHAAEHGRTWSDFLDAAGGGGHGGASSALGCGHRSPLNYDRTRWAVCVRPPGHDGNHVDGDGRWWTDRTMPAPARQESPPPGGEHGRQEGET